MLRLSRWVFRLAIFVIVAALIAVGIDYGARILTQDEIASAVKRSSGAKTAKVSISSFPYLYHLADKGEVNEVTVTASGVPAGAVTLTRVRLVADGVVIDRSDLLHGKEQLKSVSKATVTVQYQLTGALATLAAGANVSAVATSSRTLEFTADGRVIYTIDLGSIDIIPDCDLQESEAGGLYSFACSVSPVPASVLAGLSR